MLWLKGKGKLICSFNISRGTKQGIFCRHYYLISFTYSSTHSHLPTYSLIHTRTFTSTPTHLFIHPHSLTHLHVPTYSSTHRNYTPTQTYIRSTTHSSTNPTTHSHIHPLIDIPTHSCELHTYSSTYSQTLTLALTRIRWLTHS